ncbi:DUF1758 domain-containing protein [Trichonephila clavipes]|nr:DUF1758 domain-containing protein [Trichonephila clavipes]
MDRKKFNLIEEERQERFAKESHSTFQLFLENSTFIIDRDVLDAKPRALLEGFSKLIKRSKFQEFEQFKLEFMNLNGNNPSLNEVQKLCYLKGALKNEASLIQSDQYTYDSLMKASEVRYENTRALVDIHIAEILSINKLNSENPSQIRSIIDKALFFGRPDCKNSPQSHIVIVYDAGHDKSGVFHSAEWHDDDWSSDGIPEAWLWCFIWVENFEFFGLAEILEVAL